MDITDPQFALTVIVSSPLAIPILRRVGAGLLAMSASRRGVVVQEKHRG